MIEQSAIIFLGHGAPALDEALALRPRRIVIGLDSHLCLSSWLGELAFRSRDGRQAMFYRLEDHVPFAAEEVWADFLASDAGVLGICAAASNLQPTVSALAAAGIVVAAICPTALLALQHALDTGSVEPGRCDALLWRSGEEIDVFFLSDGRLVGWHVVPAEASDVGRILLARAEIRSSPLRIGVIAVDPDLLETLREMEPRLEFSAIELPLTIAESATLVAEMICSRRASAPADLRGVDGGGRRQGRLGGAGRAVAAAFISLCVAAMFAMILRGVQYHNRAELADEQSRSAYALVFPHSPIPLGIESRLRSTVESLGLAATASSSARPGADAWLLPLLDRTLRHLPTKLRFTVDALRLEDYQFVLQGRVLSFTDADALAAALRTAPGVSVEEPQTQRTDSAVAFTLTGRISGSGTESGRQGK